MLRVFTIVANEVIGLSATECTLMQFSYNPEQIHQAPYIVKGYRLWDKVSCNGTECFITGRRTSGYFALKKLDGTVISNSISYKKLRLLEVATNYITERK